MDAMNMDVQLETRIVQPFLNLFYSAQGSAERIGLGDLLVSLANNEGLTSLNTLQGDVFLLAGSNITITPSGNNLTIASSGGGGGGVTSFNSRTGVVTPQASDYSSFYLPLTGGTVTGTLNLGSALGGGSMGLWGQSGGRVGFLAAYGTSTYNLYLPTSGGTTGQLLTSGGGGGIMTWSNATVPTWGSITGSISSQTDLQTEFGLYLPLTGGTLTNNNASLVPLTVNAASGQTANLLSLVDQYSAQQLYVDNDGSLHENNYSYLGGLRIFGNAYPNTIFNNGNPISITTTAGLGLSIDSSGNTVTTGNATFGPASSLLWPDTTNITNDNLGDLTINAPNNLNLNAVDVTMINGSSFLWTDNAQISNDGNGNLIFNNGAAEIGATFGIFSSPANPSPTENSFSMGSNIGMSWIDYGIGQIVMGDSATTNLGPYPGSYVGLGADGTIATGGGFSVIADGGAVISYINSNYTDFIINVPYGDMGLNSTGNIGFGNDGAAAQSYVEGSTGIIHANKITASGAGPGYLIVDSGGLGYLNGNWIVNGNNSFLQSIDFSSGGTGITWGDGSYITDDGSGDMYLQASSTLNMSDGSGALIQSHNNGSISILASLDQNLNFDQPYIGVTWNDGNNIYDDQSGHLYVNAGNSGSQVTINGSAGVGLFSLNGSITTANNVLDDGSGNMSINGQINFNQPYTGVTWNSGSSIKDDGSGDLSVTASSSYLSLSVPFWGTYLNLNDSFSMGDNVGNSINSQGNQTILVTAINGTNFNGGYGATSSTSSTTGTVDAPIAPVVAYQGSGVTSIRSIATPAIDGMVMYLTNQTGFAMTIQSSGAAPGGYSPIICVGGTNSTVLNQGSVTFVYNGTNGTWMLIKG